METLRLCEGEVSTIGFDGVWGPDEVKWVTGRIKRL